MIRSWLPSVTVGYVVRHLRKGLSQQIGWSLILFRGRQGAYRAFFEEGWLPDMICDLGCGGASVFEIKPTNFEYPPEGGEQILEIIVGKSDKWTITQAE